MTHLQDPVGLPAYDAAEHDVAEPAPRSLPRPTVAGILRVRTMPEAAWAVIAALIVVAFGAFGFAYAVNGHPLSIVDEHVHFDTAEKLQHGQLVHRGSLYGDELLKEWACGVGHQAGGLAHGCADPKLSIKDLPSGIYTTGYIHYPTYFAAAVVFHNAVEAVLGHHDDLAVYRLFSALLLTLGVALCGVTAWVFGIRRAGLIAAVTLPVAASSITVLGGMVSPNSTVILTGALIALTGLSWIRRGTGFAWFALAVALASINVVIGSLPVGGFLIAALVAIVARRRGWTLTTEWQPRIRHLVILAAVVLAPIVIWGRYIAATATISNAELYGHYKISGWQAIATGAIQELAVPHSPWTDGSGGTPAPVGSIRIALRYLSQNWPLWTTIFVVGALVFTVLRSDFPTKDLRDRVRDRTLDPLHLVAVGTLVTLVLYPAALRISNAYTFGMDIGIVARYSTAFAPLLVLLALLTLRTSRHHRAAAAIGSIGVVAAVAVFA